MEVTSTEAYQDGALLFQCRGRSTGGYWGDLPPKTYESTFIHQYFLQFGKKHSRSFCCQLFCH